MINLTIQEDIDYGMAQEYSHRTLQEGADVIYARKNETIRIPMNPFINKYKEYFDDYIYPIFLTDIQCSEYRFSPKKFCQHFYKTTAYWSILLYINDCHSILDFDPDGVVYVVPQTILENLLNEILILEEVV